MAKLHWMAMIGAAALALAGCSGNDNEYNTHGDGADPHGHSEDAHDEGRAEEDHGHAHAHSAKYGGVLVEIGDHFANFEVLLLEADFTATIYTLDAHAENNSRVPDKSLTLEIALEGGPVLVELPGVANALTGETVGDTSEFTASLTEEQFRAVADGKATVKTVTVRGATFTDVALGPVATVR
ncbi:MAG: hypothetical protein SF028_08275 [Candidatus Sumerlaeia bacterium]|nr:hypothetical protein [Candidatus Sumerlaeia bacterium]